MCLCIIESEQQLLVNFPNAVNIFHILENYELILIPKIIIYSLPDSLIKFHCTIFEFSKISTLILRMIIFLCFFCSLRDVIQGRKCEKNFVYNTLVSLRIIN